MKVIPSEITYKLIQKVLPIWGKYFLTVGIKTVRSPVFDYKYIQKFIEKIKYDFNVYNITNYFDFEIIYVKPTDKLDKRCMLEVNFTNKESYEKIETILRLKGLI